MSTAEADERYVRVLDGDWMQYHHRAGEGMTECGISYTTHEHQTFADPGDAFIECHDCRMRSGVGLSNRELVNILGDHVGFETDEDQTPGYLNKTQLIAIKDHIESLQSQLDED